MSKHAGVVLAAALAAALIGGALALGMRLGKGASQAGLTRTLGSTSARTPALPLASPGPVLLKVPINRYSGTRPSTITFSGDGGNVVTRIHWASWASDSAVGYGIVGLNNCTPNCAEGQTTYQNVTITLFDPIGSPLIWAKMTEAISGEAPLRWTYPNNWPLSAS